MKSGWAGARGHATRGRAWRKPSGWGAAGCRWASGKHGHAAHPHCGGRGPVAHGEWQHAQAAVQAQL